MVTYNTNIHTPYDIHLFRSKPASYGDDELISSCHCVGFFSSSFRFCIDTDPPL